MSFELTTDDLFRLEKLRLERLCQFFAEPLNQALMHLDDKRTLTIHCPHSWIVDQLLNDIDQFRWSSWVIVGVREISICYAQEEIFRITTHQPHRRSPQVRT